MVGAGGVTPSGAVTAAIMLGGEWGERFATLQKVATRRGGKAQIAPISPAIYNPGPSGAFSATTVTFRPYACYI
jgi:hypothetical protein